MPKPEPQRPTSAAVRQLRSDLTGRDKLQEKHINSLLVHQFRICTNIEASSQKPGRRRTQNFKLADREQGSLMWRDRRTQERDASTE